jgi:endonuclease/exonuclease/phosphatase family metal-dependent hydrolase
MVLATEGFQMPKLRVMTYNVRYFAQATRGVASTLRPLQGIARAIARLDPVPDLICLQEVETRSIRSTVARRRGARGLTQLEQLMEALREALLAQGKEDAFEAYYFSAHTYRFFGRSPLYTTGLAILAHRDFEVGHHNAAKPHDITHRRIHAVRRLKQTRICGHLRFRHRSGHSIDVFNTHLSLPSVFAREFWKQRDHLGWGENQLQEAHSLALCVEQQRESDRFVVLGDFNSRPGSPVYDYLTRERGLVDAFARVKGLAPEDLGRWPTAGFLRLRFRVDHVFSGPGLEWLDFEGSHPFGLRGGLFHGLSDHVPIIGTCRVR